MMPLVKRALFHSGLLGLARMARQRVRGVVLRYHALTDDEREVLYAAPDICMPVAAFRLQMAFVKRAYTVLPLDELVSAVVAGGPAAAFARDHVRRRLRGQPSPRHAGPAAPRPAGDRLRRHRLRRGRTGLLGRRGPRTRHVGAGRGPRAAGACAHSARARGSARVGREGADARPRAVGGAGARELLATAAAGAQASTSTASSRAPC